MSALRLFARPALAGFFVIGGIDAFRHPKEAAEGIDPNALALARRLGLPDEPVQLAKINAAVQAVAGTMLAFGRFPRLASGALMATMVPANLVGPRYWEATDPEVRARQKMQFLKNLALGGGLLLAVADTAGRPSLSWWAQRSAHRAGLAAAGVAAAATDAVSGVVGTASGVASGAAAGVVGAVGALEQLVTDPRRSRRNRRRFSRAAHRAESAGAVLRDGASTLRRRGPEQLHKRATKLRRQGPDSMREAASTVRDGAEHLRSSAKEVLAGVPHHLPGH